MCEAHFSFENLKAWQCSRELVKNVYKLLPKFPAEERFALCDQIRRAIISVPSNLAEGSGRISRAEQRHFYEISYGSLMEVYNQLILSVDLGYISDDDIKPLKHDIWFTAKCISNLRNSIKD